MRMLRDDEEKNIRNLAHTLLKKTNRLGKEKSPYLLQHANNPVDWYPWCEEAFEKARQEDKPIFLSIGYSTCYWCHVMEREVFENQSIADMMNLMVVSIKVDREERPDIDQIYMTALQAMMGNGGWPMSIFMTPDRKPFFAATYIPPTNRYGNPGFPEILHRIHNVWTNERAKVLENSERIEQFLATSALPPKNDQQVSGQILEKGFAEFSARFDSEYGGFSPAPKFPSSTNIHFLFRYYHRTGNSSALDMALTTLKKMSEGGIYDRIGGGFHRYSTDERWNLPHFEKMLYDQAQIVISYLEAFQITRDRRYARIAQKTLGYVQRALMHPEGGFYSAEDAESSISFSSLQQKKEGAYYTWKKQEIEETLTSEEAKIICFVYGIEADGNVRSDPRQEFFGENILYSAHTLEEYATWFGIKVEEAVAMLDMAKLKMFDARQARPSPHLDDKILLSWNGLMISAFARAYQVLKDESFLQDARQAARFLLKKIFHPSSGRLLRRYRKGEAKYDAQLADYAFFVQALLDLYEASFEIEWLKYAINLTDRQIKLFYDDSHGGFFNTSESDPTVLIRIKDAYDNAEPSGNAISILNLLRLSHILNNNTYHEMAKQSLECFGRLLDNTPHAFPQLMIALDYFLFAPVHIILAGSRKHPVLEEMTDEIHSHFLPNKILLLADSAEGQRFLKRYESFYGTFSKPGGMQKVYICQNDACELPTSDLGTLKRSLENIVQANALSFTVKTQDQTV